MTQKTHFEATGVAAKINTDLTSGCYTAQVRGTHNLPGVLFATATEAPGDLADWFQARAGETFTFRAGGNATPVWVRMDPTLAQYHGADAVAVAIARTGP